MVPLRYLDVQALNAHAEITRETVLFSQVASLDRICTSPEQSPKLRDAGCSCQPSTAHNRTRMITAAFLPACPSVENEGDDESVNVSRSRGWHPYSTHPYNPSTSAKMRIRTMPTKILDCCMYARTPCASQYMPFALSSELLYVPRRRQFQWRNRQPNQSALPTARRPCA